MLVPAREDRLRTVPFQSVASGLGRTGAKVNEPRGELERSGVLNTMPAEKLNYVNV